MERERIIDVFGGKVRTQSGISSLMGNFIPQIGDYVYVDSGYVFGHQNVFAKSPIVIASKNAKEEYVLIESCGYYTFNIVQYSLDEEMNVRKKILKSDITLSEIEVIYATREIFIFAENKILMVAFVGNNGIVRTVVNGKLENTSYFDLGDDASNLLHACAYIDDEGALIVNFSIYNRSTYNSYIMSYKDNVLVDIICIFTPDNEEIEKAKKMFSDNFQNGKYGTIKAYWNKKNNKYDAYLHKGDKYIEFYLTDSKLYGNKETIPIFDKENTNISYGYSADIYNKKFLLSLTLQHPFNSYIYHDDVIPGCVYKCERGINQDVAGYYHLYEYGEFCKTDDPVYEINIDENHKMIKTSDGIEIKGKYINTKNTDAMALFIYGDNPVFIVEVNADLVFVYGFMNFNLTGIDYIYSRKLDKFFSANNSTMYATMNIGQRKVYEYSQALKILGL